MAHGLGYRPAAGGEKMESHEKRTSVARTRDREPSDGTQARFIIGRSSEEGSREEEKRG
jgi:hypothetical protein